MDEFLTDEFFLKLVRLGVVMPDKRLEIRKVLVALDKLREREDEASLKTASEKKQQAVRGKPCSLEFDAFP